MIAEGMGAGGWKVVGGRRSEERGWSTMVFVGEVVLPGGGRREEGGGWGCEQGCVGGMGSGCGGVCLVALEGVVVEEFGEGVDLGEGK